VDRRDVAHAKLTENSSSQILEEEYRNEDEDDDRGRIHHGIENFLNCVNTTSIEGIVRPHSG